MALSRTVQPLAPIPVSSAEKSSIPRSPETIPGYETLRERLRLGVPHLSPVDFLADLTAYLEIRRIER
jgi:hypothetical protein